MNKTIIHTSGGGRLGNQLNNYTALLAFKLEYPEFEMVSLPIMPFLDDYGRPDLPLAKLDIKNSFFRTTLNILYNRNNRDSWVSFLLSKISGMAGFKRNIRVRLLYKIAVWRNDSHSLVGKLSPNLPGQQYEHIDLSKQEILDKLREKPISIIAGYLCGPTELIKKHKDKIRKRLQPGEKYNEKVKKFVKPLKAKYDQLVGVHIRQGDYKNWKNGKHYFKSEKYLEIIKEYEKKHPDQSIAFLIASNEKQDESLFNKDNYYLGLGNKPVENYVEDLVKLSMCDTILAPRSSFSRWAAFIGETPLILIHEKVIPEGFKKIENVIPQR